MSTTLCFRGAATRFAIRSLLALTATAGLNAGPITGLWNTGKNGSNVVHCLGDCGNGTLEINWQANGGQAYVYTANVLLPGSYMVNDANSMWISATADGVFNTAPFTLNFNLPVGFSSANIVGRWASDNCGTGFLNNVQFTDIACGQGASTFRTWTNFSIPNGGGFQGGQNTIRFDQNAQGFGAIRIEFLESNVSEVPEPATILSLGGALCLLGFLGRKRR